MKKKAKGDGYFFAQQTLSYKPKGAVIAQIQPNACVAATARMILKDIGIHISEAELRVLFEIDEDGISPSKIPEVLAQFGLFYIYKRNLTIGDLQIALQKFPAILYVSSSLLKIIGHVIIVDGITDNFALIRDSQDGVSYKLSINDLELYWLDSATKNGRAALRIK